MEIRAIIYQYVLSGETFQVDGRLPIVERVDRRNFFSLRYVCRAIAREISDEDIMRWNTFRAKNTAYLCDWAKQLTPEQAKDVYYVEIRTDVLWRTECRGSLHWNFLNFAPADWPLLRCFRESNASLKKHLPRLSQLEFIMNFEPWINMCWKEENEQELERMVVKYKTLLEEYNEGVEVKVSTNVVWNRETSIYTTELTLGPRGYSLE